MGARTEVVKQMFATSLKEYASRSHLVEEAEIFEGCAIVVSEKLPDNSEVVAAQAANDLLTIEGVRASFVAVLQDDAVRISARSMGEINVQLVMEKLGGGGHLTMAGAQLEDVTYEVARTKILRAVSEYLSENRNRKPPKDVESD